MRPFTPILACLIAFLPLLHGHAAPPADPRQYTDGVARVIEAHYFDAERGRLIADELRDEARRGEFDAFRDRHELATALTARLKPLDRHFSVSWRPPTEGTPAPRQGAGARPSPEACDRKRNHGIRRVEVLPGKVGYLDLRQFAHFEYDCPGQPARDAIDAALALLADVDALIIDLRANGGGSPAMVGYLASAFVPPDADIYNTFISRSGTSSEAPREPHARPRLELPLYLLVSARTGSAAESFAYTLKNAGRAVVVGEATAGAANPGDEFDAGDGFHVFVSTGSPVSPVTGGNWETEGVQPDVDGPPADALRMAHARALESVLETGLPEATGARWALEALQAESAAPAPASLADYTGRYGVIEIEARESGLLLRNGRRPPMPLRPLGGDLFTSADDPGFRIRFERDPDEQVIALETLRPDGGIGRFRRDE
ncbi:S41 family peptidase [Marilutibacter alkalisoli]|uniref:S41 family peptidase n=1 Tax=Marilutibacter alkalisoli TaxID=2591633 RepID=A0A514BNF4_9GAMM|nr:S41 family peptidase [Lysobacter alkalisoli]QDH68917.1 S41 family peptidase [Lysobacter alkalisoli]